MTIMIGGEQVARLTDLRRSAKALVGQLKVAKTEQESRVILTTHGEPVAVLQEYGAYQKMMGELEEMQRQLLIARGRERMQLMNEGKMGTLSLEEAINQYRAPKPDNVSD